MKKKESWQVKHRKHIPGGYACKVHPQEPDITFRLYIQMLLKVTQADRVANSNTQNNSVTWEVNLALKNQLAVGNNVTGAKG